MNRFFIITLAFYAFVSFNVMVNTAFAFSQPGVSPENVEPITKGQLRATLSAVGGRAHLFHSLDGKDNSSVLLSGAGGGIINFIAINRMNDNPDGHGEAHFLSSDWNAVSITYTSEGFYEVDRGDCQPIVDAIDGAVLVKNARESASLLEGIEIVQYLNGIELDSKVGATIPGLFAGVITDDMGDPAGSAGLLAGCASMGHRYYAVFPPGSIPTGPSTVRVELFQDGIFLGGITREFVMLP